MSKSNRSSRDLLSLLLWWFVFSSISIGINISTIISSSSSSSSSSISTMIIIIIIIINMINLPPATGTARAGRCPGDWKAARDHGLLLLLLLSLLLLLWLIVVVVPNGHLGALWTKCMFFKKRCSRLGQKQLLKSTSMQKHTFLIWSATKTKNGCRLGEMHLFEFTFILYKRLSEKRALA